MDFKYPIPNKRRRTPQLHFPRNKIYNTADKTNGEQRVSLTHGNRIVAMGEGSGEGFVWTERDLTPTTAREGSAAC